MYVETDEFTLDLVGDWTQWPSDGPHQFVFNSAALRSSLVISFLLVQLPRERLLEMADRMLGFRLDAEEELSDFNLGFSFTELNLDGSVARAAYGGVRPTGIVSFEAWATERKFLNFWLMTETGDPDHARAVFDATLAGLRFFEP